MSKASPQKSKPTRRKFILAAGAVVGAATVAIKKPRDKSGEVLPYFTKLSGALKRAGIGTATMVIDRALLHKNIDVLNAHLPTGMGYRIVSKSLPSFGLLEDVMARSGSKRVMAFNVDFIKKLIANYEDIDVLLGKPLPIFAADDFYQTLKSANKVKLPPIQWLVDTQARITQYEDLAKAQNLILDMNLEIDIGLHRGGFVEPKIIAQAIQYIRNSKHLRFSGFMGYDPHVASAPTAFGMQKRAKNMAWSQYQAALDIAQEILGGDYNSDTLTRNAAGSPTYKLYNDTSLANEVSVGSALIKPTHFDTNLLEDHLPAAFIATPVIKRSQGLNLPVVGKVANNLMEFWDPNKRNTIFVHGGNWYADPVSPPGLAYNPIFGRSSNQEMLNGSAKLNLQPDDYVFFRPHQSEAVLMQFGDIAVYEDGEITDFWKVFPASA